MLVDRIVKLWLLPRNANCPSGDLFQGEFGRGRDVKPEFLDKNLIGGLANLPSTI